MKQSPIESKDNERIRFLRKLTYKKHREKFGRFFVENIKIIHDAAKNGIFPESVFCTENFFDRHKKEIEFVIQKAGDENLCFIGDKVNKSFSELTTPSGVAVIYVIPEFQIKENKPVVYLNGINDPGNLGTIIRSAAAFDFGNLILDELCADAFNYKTVNASKDAIFKVNIAYDENLKKIKQLKKKMSIYSTAIKSGEDAAKIKKGKAFCLVFGSEARGVDDKILKLSDGLINIKTNGQVESLNVACAASIIFSKLYKG
ncbi:MAG TPA: RNA methyltransferase [Candidatus Bipolaricaulota bacterium]|nr:RNA methyltransferase [Candidatus Bipolaricaulota bacterium]